MGKLEGVRIQNFGPLKNIVMGKTLSNSKGGNFEQYGCDYRSQREWEEYAGR